MGDKGGKSDMERVGLFQEMSYHTVGDKYTAPGIQFNVAAGKGKQMLLGGLKDRSAKQDGYFADKFDRVFEGEAYSDPIKQRRQHRIKESQKNLGKPFMPSNPPKKRTGLGNYHGTIGGTVPAFSAQNKTAGAYKAPNKNFYTNPGKKGTGFGYLSVTLGQFPKHMSDPYNQVALNDKKLLEQHRSKVKGGAFRLNMHPKDYFDEKPYTSDKPLPPPKKLPPPKPITTPFKPSHPAKSAAGCKAGTFEIYPTHSVDPYGKQYKRPVHVVNKTGKTFIPNQGPKSAPITSIINQNVVNGTSSVVEIAEVNPANARTLQQLSANLSNCEPTELQDYQICDSALVHRSWKHLYNRSVGTRPATTCAATAPPDYNQQSPYILQHGLRLWHGL